MQYAAGNDFRLEKHEATSLVLCTRCHTRVYSGSFIRLRPGGKSFCTTKCAWYFYHINS